MPKTFIAFGGPFDEHNDINKTQISNYTEGKNNTIIHTHVSIDMFMYSKHK